jgi:two-component system, cell cycle sensor histidine kinase and response regulator CckA
MYVAFSTTASAAQPVPPESASALTLTLGCLSVALLCAVLVLRVRLRNRPATAQGAAPAPGAAEILQSARDAIFVIQESGEILSTNPAAEKLFGYSFSELSGKSISALIPPPARGRRRSNYIHAAEGRELNGVRKSGQNFPLDLMLSELPGGKRFSVIVRDRSDRNRAEQELENEKRFSATLIDHLPALLTVVDHEGRIVRFNRTCEDLTQFSEGEIRGQYLWQAVAAPSGMERAEQQFHQLLDGEFPARSDSEWCLRDNSMRTISWNHNALRDEFGRLTHVVSTGVDVTHTRQIEAGLRETDALSAAGRLAGGIAHDFNNLLTAITGYSGLAIVNLDENDPVRADIDEIRRSSDRGAAITRQLLTFSGHQPRAAQTIDLNEAARNVERLVRIMGGDRVHVDFSLEDDLPPVVADRVLIEECIMHLAANAREAMPAGGTLQIQTGVRSLNRMRYDARPPIGPGDYVTLSVVDTGKGIPTDALPHIFEPYYTTKDAPVSNGMGLAMVYGIVRQAGGSIVVHTAPDYGSTFRIFLPLAAERRPKQSKPSPDEQPLRGDETVLVAIEFDADRKRLRETLQQAGYTVLESRSALQSLEIAHKSPGPIHLLMTDVTMTRMHGPALAESVQASRPEIRVLYATSRGAAEIQNQNLEPDAVIRLDRTTNARTILTRVREVLNANSRQ